MLFRYVVKAFPVLSFIMAAAFLGACANMNLPSAKGYSDLCQVYVSQDVNRIIDEWGYPGRTYDEKGGGRVLTYVETRDEYAINPLAHMALIQTPPRPAYEQAEAKGASGVIGQPVTSMDYCITYVYVDKNNKIQSILWRGDCKALTPAQNQGIDAREKSMRERGIE